VNLVTRDMVKPGAVVIDVGYQPPAQRQARRRRGFRRGLGGRGLDHARCPGGVGPMTIAMLLWNTVKSAERAAGLGTGAETRIA
jgi:methylenetetrahydrofolate dehydrogenase (NADP+)/methenyltetrahydrofolate cyclohydrolase